MAASILHWITAGDHRLMHRVNRWTPPKWMRLWMVAATRGGDGWLWYTTGLLIALAGGPLRFHAILAAFTAVAVGIGLFISIKKACGRKRPCALEPHCWATLLPPDQFSFPSGHTITAFAMASSVGVFYPALLGILMFCAVSIALSRILLGMHFLTDVLAGAVIGTGLGLVAANLLL
ncbi:MAG: phosphatase PAP2 family protein [Bryobacteraceae bacterium]